MSTQIRSTPKSRGIRSWVDSHDLGGTEALWHGLGCVCDACVAQGYACACRDPHCEGHKENTK